MSVIGQLPVIEEAIKLYDQGKYSESIRALETASRNDDLKDDAKLWSYLGLAYLKNDEIKKARKPSEKAVKLEPQNAVFRTNLSYVYLMNGQINKSQSEAETSIQIDPKQTMAYYLMGIGHLWEGDPDTAETYAEKILANDAAFPQGYLLKSDVFVELLGKRVAAGSSIKEEVDFLKKSVDVLERGLQNSSTAAGRKMLADKLEGMKAFYSHYSKDRSMHPPFRPFRNLA
ncbi:MAG: tetratricopeptide repeat protein [Pyrinomonadaceae bacterium]